MKDVIVSIEDDGGTSLVSHLIIRGDRLVARCKLAVERSLQTVELHDHAHAAVLGAASGIIIEHPSVFTASERVVSIGVEVSQALGRRLFEEVFLILQTRLHHQCWKQEKQVYK